MVLECAARLYGGKMLHSVCPWWFCFIETWCIIHTMEILKPLFLYAGGYFWTEEHYSTRLIIFRTCTWPRKRTLFVATRPALKQRQVLKKAETFVFDSDLPCQDINGNFNCHVDPGDHSGTPTDPTWSGPVKTSRGTVDPSTSTQLMLL